MHRYSLKRRWGRPNALWDMYFLSSLLVSMQKKFSKVALQTVTMSEDLSEERDIDAEYSSQCEDENNNELEDYISDPDYDVTSDPLAKAQWMRDVSEERRSMWRLSVNLSDSKMIPRWKTGNHHPHRKSKYRRKPGLKIPAR